MRSCLGGIRSGWDQVSVGSGLGGIRSEWDQGARREQQGENMCVVISAC